MCNEIFVQSKNYDEFVVRNIFCLIHIEIFLPDWVTKVLGGNTHSCSGHAEQSRGSVVEFEHPVVDLNLIELEPAGKIMNKMSHVDVILF